MNSLSPLPPPPRIWTWHFDIGQRRTSSLPTPELVMASIITTVLYSFPVSHNACSLDRPSYFTPTEYSLIVMRPSPLCSKGIKGARSPSVIPRSLPLAPTRQNVETLSLISYFAQGNLLFTALGRKWRPLTQSGKKGRKKHRYVVARRVSVASHSWV